MMSSGRQFRSFFAAYSKSTITCCRQFMGGTNRASVSEDLSRLLDGVFVTRSKLRDKYHEDYTKSRSRSPDKTWCAPSISQREFVNVLVTPLDGRRCQLSSGKRTVPQLSNQLDVRTFERQWHIRLSSNSVRCSSNSNRLLWTVEQHSLCHSWSTAEKFAEFKMICCSFR